MLENGYGPGGQAQLGAPSLGERVHTVQVNVLVFLHLRGNRLTAQTAPSAAVGKQPGT